VRSIASRGHSGGLSPAVADNARLLRATGYTWVLIETVGAGQVEIDIAARADLTVVIQAPGMGDEIQALKKGILEIADLIVVNKNDQPGAGELQRQLGRWAAAPERVLSLCAESGDGIEALLAAITARRGSTAGKPVHLMRRDEVRTLAMAQLRERLEIGLSTLDLSSGNTWELAEKLLANLGNNLQ
jgi:LAO/AO transport system kinase